MGTQWHSQIHRQMEGTRVYREAVPNMHTTCVVRGLRVCLQSYLCSVIIFLYEVTVPKCEIVHVGFEVGCVCVCVCVCCVCVCVCVWVYVIVS